MREKKSKCPTRRLLSFIVIVAGAYCGFAAELASTGGKESINPGAMKPGAIHPSNWWPVAAFRASASAPGCRPVFFFGRQAADQLASRSAAARPPGRAVEGEVVFRRALVS
jgi:hypothetical protein